MGDLGLFHIMLNMNFLWLDIPLQRISRRQYVHPLGER